MGNNIGAKILLNKDMDAIFASSDQLALGIIQKLKENKINIPNDIAVIGFDNIKLAKFITPSLSTIAQPKKYIASTSVSMLQNLIDKVPLTNNSVVLEPSLIIRESTTRNKSSHL
jgi:DNA-binding LacI/PurR family transcriptional regulator